MGSRQSRGWRYRCEHSGPGSAAVPLSRSNLDGFGRVDPTGLRSQRNICSHECLNSLSTVVLDKNAEPGTESQGKSQCWCSRGLAEHLDKDMSSAPASSLASCCIRIKRTNHLGLKMHNVLKAWKCVLERASSAQGDTQSLLFPCT